MLKKVAIGSLKPNPFRRLDEYPIQREKVEALKNSIEHTGFWKTIIGRPVAGGFVEVAFGHHRLVALQELFGPKESVEIIVEELTNEAMLKMMANENMAEWGSDGWVEVETIRATIEAYGKGLIRLPEVPKKTRDDQVRHVSLNSVIHDYTKGSVAQFLGWTKSANGGSTVQPNNRCGIAFDAIDAIDTGLVKAADLRGLARYKIQELVAGARRVRDAELAFARQQEEDAKRAKELAEAAQSEADRKRLERRAEVHQMQAAQHKAMADDRSRQFVDMAAPKLHAKKGGHEEVRELARNMATPVQKEPAPVKDVSGHADQLARKLANILDGDDGLSAQLALIREFKAGLSPDSARKLVREATLLRLRLEQMIVTAFPVD